MNQTSRPSHPDAASLLHFALGRLGSKAMQRVERHVRACDACVQAALAAPDDRLVGLLRRPRADSPVQNALNRAPASGNSAATLDAMPQTRCESESKR